MFYDGYHIGGMHLVWWIVWISFLFWVFATPYDIPFRRKRSDSPADILKKRFAAGHITKEQYQKDWQILENDIFM
jgi:putative membrane protein